MNKTFAALKTEAQNASSADELFRIAKASNAKLLRNVNRAKLMSYTHGMAADASHYFENVIPGWQRTNNEIHAMLRSAMEPLSAEQRIAIISAAS